MKSDLTASSETLEPTGFDPCDELAGAPLPGPPLFTADFEAGAADRRARRMATSVDNIALGADALGAMLYGGAPPDPARWAGRLDLIECAARCLRADLAILEDSAR